MIQKIKGIMLPTWCQIAIVGALFSAGGLLLAQTNEKIDTKANNETIVKALNMMESQRVEDRTFQVEQRKEDQQDLKDQRKEQQETNKQLYKSIQMILIKMEVK